MNVEITLITHVFIGGGGFSVLSPYVDFVVRGRYVELVERDKLLNLFSSPQWMDRYKSFLNQNWRNNRFSKTLQDFLRENKIPVDKVLSGRKIAVEGDIKGREVSLFSASVGRSYIPGSTIKGSIRTALCYAYIDRKGADAKRRIMGNILRVKTNGIKRFSPKSAFPTLVGGDVGPKFRAHDDPLKLLQVSDTTFFSEDEMIILNAYVLRMNKPAEVEGTPVVYEVARKGAKVRARIKIAKAFARGSFQDGFWDFLLRGDYCKLFRYINAFSLDFVKCERRRLSKFRGSVPTMLAKFYEKLEKKIESGSKTGKVAYMMVGRGTTLFGKTVDNIFTEEELQRLREAFKGLRNFGWKNGKLVNPFPITRLVPETNPVPFGWIEVRAIGV